MLHRAARNTLLGLTICLPAFNSMPAWAQADTESRWTAPDQWFVYTVVFIFLVGTLLALLFIRAALASTAWSLADALSEETELGPAMIVDPSGNKVPSFDPSGKPVMTTELRASSSRLIALMGMMAILLMFLGFGSFALYSFAYTGTMPPDVDKVIMFMVGGMTLFAPYVVNKFSTIFESLSPKTG